MGSASNWPRLSRIGGASGYFGSIGTFVSGPQQSKGRSGPALQPDPKHRRCCAMSPPSAIAKLQPSEVTIKEEGTWIHKSRFVMTRILPAA
ncbi:hypothetical protein R1flu_029146 [Riccia fluitans]|uniref:Uncharacterized protein n=1 Tax=Riccia fluitans TaxID=41844 RepID=A0ABD1XSS8_9MARC